jgi:hypothetical protein
MPARTHSVEIALASKVAQGLQRDIAGVQRLELMDNEDRIRATGPSADYLAALGIDLAYAVKSAQS